MFCASKLFTYCSCGCFPTTPFLSPLRVLEANYAILGKNFSMRSVTAETDVSSRLGKHTLIEIYKL